jgi:hypothetical protein
MDKYERYEQDKKQERSFFTEPTRTWVRGQLQDVVVSVIVVAVPALGGAAVLFGVYWLVRFIKWAWYQ